MACVQKCPRKCISVKENFLGHLYPNVDKQQCVQCGLCQKSCPEINPPFFRKSERAYAAWSLDPKSRKSSSSGGAAAELYSAALNSGVWISGVEFQDGFHVVHTLSDKHSSILRYKQSKYVYSELRNIYREIENLLKQGEQVLFISLPCKVAGLLSFLGKEYDGLTTVDIVCHGTPSYRNLEEHISSVSSGKRATKLKFRNDNEFLFELIDEAEMNVYEKIGRADAYLAAFLEGLDYRESCYHCSYARPERVSDLTICDFWGLGQEIPFEHPYTGSISAVLINTEKGNRLFKQGEANLFVEERPVEEVVKGNAQLNAPTPEHPKREEFEQVYMNRGFDEAVNVCLGDVMAAEEKRVKKQQVRKRLRRIAGVFFKRYRG